MIEKKAPTFNVSIHMAGDIRFAAHTLQRWASYKGMCVSLTPETFIYSGGREEGFKVGLINYPRFPSHSSEILKLAEMLAESLMIDLGQYSYSIVTPVETIWRSRMPDEAKAEENPDNPSARSAPSRERSTEQADYPQHQEASDAPINLG